MADEIKQEPAEAQPAGPEDTLVEPETPTLSREQEEILLKRLRDLGYVD
jgi:hypothetical protein